MEDIFKRLSELEKKMSELQNKNDDNDEMDIDDDESIDWKQKMRLPLIQILKNDIDQKNTIIKGQNKTIESLSIQVQKLESCYSGDIKWEFKYYADVESYKQKIELLEKENHKLKMENQDLEYQINEKTKYIDFMGNRRNELYNENQKLRDQIYPQVSEPIRIYSSDVPITMSPYIIQHN